MGTARMSPAARTWRRRIESGTFTAAECRAFATVAARLADDRPVKRRTTLDDAEAGVLVAAIRERGGMDLTPDHTARGLDWLRRYGATRVREIDDGAPFPVDRLADFARFTYRGDHSESGWRHSVPVWRVEFRDGSALDYTATAWQADAYDRTRPPAPGWWEWIVRPEGDA